MMHDESGNRWSEPQQRGKFPVKVSPVFWLILLITLFSAGMAYHNQPGMQLWIFLLVLSGWIVSLSLHEFGHALAAYYGGDSSVAGKGYLTLNPVKYTNLFMSIVIPVVFLMMGGIGFPGGAVYVSMGAIRSRRWRSLVSAAGPLATAGCAFLLLIPFFMGFSQNLNPEQLGFWSALALLIFLQITALVLNLLPVPGLDGFGIIEPYLSPRLMHKLRDVGGLFILAMFFLLFSDTPVRKGFWLFIRLLLHLLGLDIALVREGFQQFRFWNI